QVVRRVPRANRPRRAVVERLGGVLADTLVAREPHVVALLLQTEQRLLSQRLQHVEARRCARVRGEIDDRVRRVETEAAAEDAALGERVALPRLEQLPRRVERAAQRALSKRPLAIREQLEATVQPRE